MALVGENHRIAVLERVLSFLSCDMEGVLGSEVPQVLLEPWCVYLQSSLRP